MDNNALEIKEIESYHGIKIKRIIWGGIVNFYESVKPKLKNKFIYDPAKDCMITYEESIIRENIYPCVIVRQDTSGKRYFYLVDRDKRNNKKNF